MNIPPDSAWQPEPDVPARPQGKPAMITDNQLAVLKSLSSGNAEQRHEAAAYIHELCAEVERLREALIELKAYNFECEAGPLENCQIYIDALGAKT